MLLLPLAPSTAGTQMVLQCVLCPDATTCLHTGKSGSPGIAAQQRLDGALEPAHSLRQLALIELQSRCQPACAGRHAGRDFSHPHLRAATRC